jgi:hypothetical protein
MKLASADLSCPVVRWGARAACAEVSTESREDSKAKHSPGFHMEPSMFGRVMLVIKYVSRVIEEQI